MSGCLMLHETEGGVCFSQATIETNSYIKSAGCLTKRSAAIDFLNVCVVAVFLHALVWFVCFRGGFLFTLTRFSS